MSFFRRYTALLSLFCILFFVSSCQAAPPDCFAYQKRAFCADVSGTLFGETVGARITYSPSGEMSVSYTSPEALEGITVMLFCDAEGKVHARASLGEMTVECDPDALGGWMTPMCAWLLPSSEALVRVQRGEEGYCLAFEDGLTLFVDAEGTPVRLDGKDFSFYAVKWSFLS